MKRFEEKVVLVSGAGSGIGQSVVYRLLREGATVIAVDISEEGLIQTRANATDAGYGSYLTTVVADISNETIIQDTIGAAVQAAGSLDVLVNAAGILRSEHTHLTSLALWNRVIAVNLTGTFLVTRLCLPDLIKSGRGVIVNFSSTSASFAHPYMAAYAASKGGIRAFTQAIASEYSKQGLRVVAVAPGSIDSGMTRAPGIPEDADLTLMAKLTPALTEGFAGPDTVAGVVAMLASDDGSFITGTEIRIDGGTHM
jgi:NAD(P)-dependent dehydrogenase (short-subunit alcohol dehydrogenase family)